MKNYSGMNHLFGNVLASIDLETTGGQPGYHEIIQIAVVPLNSEYEPHQGVRPFYMNIAPEFPERAEADAMRTNGLDLDDLIINAPSQSKVIDLLSEWFLALELPVNKLLTPLSCNWAFESKFLTAWLGRAMTESMFHGHARDPMEAAIFLNDRAARAGETPPFPSVGLKALAARFGVVNERPHDALHDSLAAAGVYKALLTSEVF